MQVSVVPGMTAFCACSVKVVDYVLNMFNSILGLARASFESLRQVVKESAVFRELCLRRRMCNTEQLHGCELVWWFRGRRVSGALAA